MRYPGRTAGVSTKECICLAGQVLIGKANDNRETDMNRLKEKLHKVKQHWKRTRGALITESTFVYPIMFFIVFFMIFFGNMFCIRAGIDRMVTEEAIESAARYADPSLAECEDGIETTLEDAPHVTRNLYRYLDIFDLSGSQSVSTGNITEGDGTYTGFFYKGS